MGGVLIANECMDDSLKNGRDVILCKLDLEKACNYVNWRFLECMLGRMGFKLNG